MQARFQSIDNTSRCMAVVCPSARIIPIIVLVVCLLALLPAA